MKYRKPWTEEQDYALLEIKQLYPNERWKQIAFIMTQKYKFKGRNQKQCRDRYQLYLKKSDHQNDEKWSRNDQTKIFQLFEKFGTKWSVIANFFTGKTCSFIKNQFYAKLRKGLRKVNNFINALNHQKREIIKSQTIYKIVSQTQCSNSAEKNDSASTERSCTKSNLFMLFQCSNEIYEREESNKQQNHQKMVSLYNWLLNFQKNTVGLSSKNKKQPENFPRNNDFISKKIEVQATQSQDREQYFLRQPSAEYYGCGILKNPSSLIRNYQQVQHSSKSSQSEQSENLQDEKEKQQKKLVKILNTEEEMNKFQLLNKQQLNQQKFINFFDEKPNKSAEQSHFQRKSIKLKGGFQKTIYSKEEDYLFMPMQAGKDSSNSQKQKNSKQSKSNSSQYKSKNSKNSKSSNIVSTPKLSIVSCQAHIDEQLYVQNKSMIEIKERDSIKSQSSSKINHIDNQSHKNFDQFSQVQADLWNFQPNNSFVRPRSQRNQFAYDQNSSMQIQYYQCCSWG